MTDSPKIGVRVTTIRLPRQGENEAKKKNTALGLGFMGLIGGVPSVIPGFLGGVVNIEGSGAWLWVDEFSSLWQAIDGTGG